jgi:hypothetical protein
MRPNKETIADLQSSIERNRTLDAARRVRRAGRPATGHEEEPEVLLQLADRLAHLNLSPESRIRQQLRSRLVAQAERQALWGWPWRALVGLRRQPLFALASTGLLLLVAAAFWPPSGWQAEMYNGPLPGITGVATYLQTEQPVGTVADFSHQSQAAMLVALAAVRNPALAEESGAGYGLAPKTTPSLIIVDHRVDLPTPAPVPAPPEE